MSTDKPNALAHLEEASQLAATLTHSGASAALKPRERQALLGLISALGQLRVEMTGQALPTRATHTISQVEQFAHAVNRRHEGSYELGMVIAQAIGGAGVYAIDAGVYAGIVARLQGEYRALGAVIEALEGHAAMLAESGALPRPSNPTAPDAIDQ